MKCDMLERCVSFSLQVSAVCSAGKCTTSPNPPPLPLQVHAMCSIVDNVSSEAMLNSALSGLQVGGTAWPGNKA